MHGKGFGFARHFFSFPLVFAYSFPSHNLACWVCPCLSIPWGLVRKGNKEGRTWASLPIAFLTTRIPLFGQVEHGPIHLIHHGKGMGCVTPFGVALAFGLLDHISWFSFSCPKFSSFDLPSSFYFSYFTSLFNLFISLFALTCFVIR